MSQLIIDPPAKLFTAGDWVPLHGQWPAVIGANGEPIITAYPLATKRLLAEDIANIQLASAAPLMLKALESLLGRRPDRLTSGDRIHLANCAMNAAYGT